MEYYALAINSVTGSVLDEIPLAIDPTWAQQINQAGLWTVQTQAGGAGGLKKSTLRGLLQAGRVSVAVCWGSGSPADYICQAGPLWSWGMQGGGSESPPIVQLGGSGFWGLPSALEQIAVGWNGASLGIGMDTSYTSSLQGIACGIVANASARWQQLIGSPMPVDIPAAIPGAKTMRYYGYQFTSAGQRLQELTQMVSGPDILFLPYFATSNTIRWRMVVGNPYLAQPGDALTFDYPGSIRSILPNSDGSKLATTSYAVGSGSDYSTLWASASDSTLTADGWPPLEFADISRSSETLPAALATYVKSEQTLYGRPQETWTATVSTDTEPPFGSYQPGLFAAYNVQDHPIILDGQYGQRILGLQNGSNVGEIQHILQATQGAV